VVSGEEVDFVKAARSQRFA